MFSFRFNDIRFQNLLTTNRIIDINSVELSCAYIVLISFHTHIIYICLRIDQTKSVKNRNYELISEEIYPLESRYSIRMIIHSKKYITSIRLEIFTFHNLKIYTSNIIRSCTGV